VELCESFYNCLFFRLGLIKGKELYSSDSSWISVNLPTGRQVRVICGKLN